MGRAETGNTEDSGEKTAAKQINLIVDKNCTTKTRVDRANIQGEQLVPTSNHTDKIELEKLLKQEQERRRQLEQQLASMQIVSNQQQAMLLATKNKMSLAAGLAKLGVWEYDPATRMFEFGDEFYALYATNVEREGRFMSFEQYIEEFVYYEDFGLFEEEKKFLVLGTGEPVATDIGHRIVRRDGVVRDVIVRRKIARDANENIVRIYGTNQDVTEWVSAEQKLKQQAETIENMAYFDSLTGLPNRYQLNNWLGKELIKSKNHSSYGGVLLIDLDDLKLLNDTCGHSFGDEAIVAAGELVVEVIGSKGFVARIAGDEFVAILPNIYDKKVLEEIAKKISQCFEKTQKFFCQNFHLSASIGIAIYPQDGDSVEEIMKNADTAMHIAKKASNSCWCFYQTEMQVEAQQKMKLIGSLRYALQRGELSLVYQPQISINGKKIFGFEALLRWHSPEHGTVSPKIFIPLAEQAGIINTLGNWVLVEACRFIQCLASLGLTELYVAVNISPKQIMADDFVESIASVIKEIGIQAKQLEIEVTESSMIASVEDGIQKLSRLKQLGVKISLDDFGTGFSSLTYLRMLPVETLKIDKSFIDIITTDIQGAKIIDSIINMAHTVNMKVVAEGVETQQQLEYLQKNNCDIIQGYIFSEPITGEKALQLLTEQG